ncbi:MAG: Penaeidin [Rhodobacteraceae bacterium HLUCCA12]|nr:MAG: Penaeidin [Rhodobacteraceae bacterium HLUCCA12]
MSQRIRFTRPVVGLLALVFLALVIALDTARSGLPDPFDAPAPLALGSGAAPEGAHCTGQ